MISVCLSSPRSICKYKCLAALFKSQGNTFVYVREKKEKISDNVRENIH